MTEVFTGAQGAPGSSFERVREAVDAAGLRYRVTRGTHIQAECPTHSDRNPSLSIDYKAGDGATFVHCQGGCNYQDVVAAIGMETVQLYDNWLPPEEFSARRARQRDGQPKGATRGTRRPESRPSLPKGRLPKRLAEVEPDSVTEWQVTTTYDYTDIDGTLIHQEVRHERSASFGDLATTEKRFTQRWPDNSGGWVEKTPAGFIPVLYRLPDLAEWIPAGRTIWLCEGAKDAERFLAIGEAATTNPSGAANFKDEQAAMLTGARVVVVLDHDLAGYRRGTRLARLLGDAASVSFVLPATTALHSDASDHFDAGHGIGDFITVTTTQLAQLERVADAEEAARLAAQAANEAISRCDLARAAEDGTSVRDDNERYAGRWAAETGKQLVRAVEARQAAQRSEDLEAGLAKRIELAVETCRAAVEDSHGAAGIEIAAALAPYLVEETPSEDEQPEDFEGNVVDFPSTSTFPAPGVSLPSSRGSWAYETGGPGRRARGVYFDNGSGRWDRVAPLPYVHARIVRRDGSGNRTGTFFLVSATPDEQGVLIGHDEIKGGSWPNILDLAISQEDKIMRAATTALVFLAQDAEEREATPRLVNGQITMPRVETMPAGYLATSDMERSEAIGVWREVLTLAAKNPRMALVLGAAAVAPFIGALKQQAHVVAMYGDPLQGKTTTLQAASSIWGYPGGDEGAGVLLSWNATALSVPAFLGDLGVLPAFMDEIGQAGDMRDGQWHQLISNITQGAVRMTRARNKPGVQLGLQWRGIFFSSGNAPMGHGATGKNSGVPRRMVELSTPFTNSAEHGEAIEELAPTAYGHVGQAILEQHSLETVRPLIQLAASTLGTSFKTSHERAMGEHLAAHLAGAKMLDDLCNTGGVLFNAALLAAAEYLDDCAPPPHDADRVLEELADWIAREPGAWPTKSQYLALKRPKTFGEGDDLPQHGFRTEFAGFLDGDGTVMITNAAWRAMVKEMEVSDKVALRALHERGLIKTQESRRRRGEWSIQSRVMGCTVYAIVLPEPEPDDAAEVHDGEPMGPTIGADGGPVGGTDNSVGGPVGGKNGPLTSSVGGVGGVGGENAPLRERARVIHFPDDSGPRIVTLESSRPCVICDYPAKQAVEGHPVHLGDCLAELDRQLERQNQAPATREPEQQDVLPDPETTPSSEASSSTESRWQFPVVTIDETTIYLPGGGTAAWPDYSHLGDLALLAHRDHLRLGHGGGETLPEAGQIWITSPAALERLGLPAQLDFDQDVNELDAGESRKVMQAALLKLDVVPAVQGALEAGWEIGRGESGHVDVWTYLKHPDLLPGGVRIVFMPYSRMLDVPIIAKSTGSADLADNLAAAAHRLGVQFSIHPGITAHNLINHTRPPRVDEYSLSGNHSTRIALVRGVQSELPPFLRNTNDNRTKKIEEDFSWWRPWDRLLASERDLTYVHAYDRNGSYLAEWETLELGVDGLQHRTGADAAWDGKEHPGYWLIERDWGEWPEPLLPPPTLGAVVEQGRVWVTTPTLLALRKVGIDPTVVESYTWSTSTRYLSQAAKILKDARTHESAAVTATAKAMYAVGSGRFAREAGTHSFDHLWRPDWFHHIKASARFKILLTLLKTSAGGTYPVAAARDTIVFLSDEADPFKAWPGQPTQLDPIKPGYWKPEASGLAAHWGPEHLPNRQPGIVYWRHLAAMEALREDSDG